MAAASSSFILFSSKIQIIIEITALVSYYGVIPAMDQYNNKKKKELIEELEALRRERDALLSARESRYSDNRSRDGKHATAISWKISMTRTGKWT